MTFTVVVIIVNLKVLSVSCFTPPHRLYPPQMMFIQTKWMAISGLLLVLSVLSWFAIAYFVTNFAILDYEWYQVSHS
jgi:hypothetical protein